MLAVVVSPPLLESGVDPISAVGVGCGHDHDVLAVVLEVLAGFWLDHDRAVGAVLLLHAGVAVEPVGAALHDREAVGEGLAARDAGETDPRQSVWRRRHDEAVPEDRGPLVPFVRDCDTHLLTLLYPQRRPLCLPVVGACTLRR